MKHLFDYLDNEAILEEIVIDSFGDKPLKTKEKYFLMLHAKTLGEIQKEIDSINELAKNDDVNLTVEASIEIWSSKDD